MPKRKFKKSAAMGILIKFSIGIALFTVAKYAGSSSSESIPESKTVTVGYFLDDMDGNPNQRCLSMTYTGSNGESITEENISPPWERIVTIQTSSSSISVSCEAKFAEGGLIRLQIASDGDSFGFAWSDDKAPLNEVDMNTRIPAH